MRIAEKVRVNLDGATYLFHKMKMIVSQRHMRTFRTIGRVKRDQSEELTAFTPCDTVHGLCEKLFIIEGNGG